MADFTAKYSLLKRKYNQKEEENLCLREQIREYECNRCNSSGISQAAMTRLEMERDSAKGDCTRLREENNALRDDILRLKETQRCDQVRLEQAQKDFDNCVSQFEVERRSVSSELKQLTEELRQYKDRVRELQTEAGDQRMRCNQFKMVNEQTEREVRTTQDLLHQTETELASALDRIQELNDETQRLEWELKEARQEKSCIKANLTRLDQEKDALLLKVDEKTEHNVRLEAELESRDRRIASLEGFIADLQKKLDVALDTAARSEQTSRQHIQETDKLRKELDKMERCRDNAVRENSRLQNDLAALVNEHQQTTRNLEISRREVEDLKLQLQGYVAEVRRITQILEEKEAERMSMLEHYRTLTVESANLETNNHSLESEARSTKSCLREAHTRIQDLETSLQEKRDLIHGYEKQIKELTHQVAKLERKLESHSRAEHATRDLSRELESQKHCLTQRMDQLVHENKQLEEEVCSLRAELSRLQEQLGKERKNSATLENVLAGARQETLQRTRDNGELKAQVQCLQTKLKDLQEKLEHGTEALRRCQSECAEYQTQVAELRREVTNERFERARVEETRRSRSIRRALKHLPSRSCSLPSPRSLKMPTPYICPCCFLNRISSLRNTPEASKELISKYNSDQGNGTTWNQSSFLAIPHPSASKAKADDKEDSIFGGVPMLMSDTTIDEMPSLMSESTITTNKLNSCNFSDDSDFIVPERLIASTKKAESHDTFSIDDTNMESGILTVTVTEHVWDVSQESLNKTELLADQIGYVLQEQKKFMKELNLPIRDSAGFKLMLDEVDEPSSRGDYTRESLNTVQKISKKRGLTPDECVANKIVFYASGDRSNISTVEKGDVNKTYTKGTSLLPHLKNKAKNRKPKVYFNEEPTKLSKPYNWVFPNDNANVNRDSATDKQLSVKTLFFPEVGMRGSVSSVESLGEQSVYVTAANSYTDANCASVTFTFAQGNSFDSVNLSTARTE